MPSYQLATYHVFYKPGGENPFIYAKDALGHMRAYMVFLDNDADLPESQELSSQGETFYRLHYHRDQFPAVIDILRNEKPVYVFYSNPTYAHICTSAEPVGEEELELP